MRDLKPAYAENNIPIVFATSSYYLPYLAVSLKSLINTADSSYNYDVLILHKEIEEENICLIKDMITTKNISVRFVEVDPKTDEHHYNFREGYSSESFYRVVMIDILENYDKIIYLDCDVIVMESISKLLMENDVTDYYVAAAKDIDGMASCVCDHENRKSYMLGFMGLKKIEEYFQSGVMIFNLRKIRENFNLQKILKVACAPEIMFGDQDVLNTLFHEKVYYLDMAWNTIVNVRRQHFQTLLLLAPVKVVDDYVKARENPYIIHYAGTKPWDEPDADMAEEYWRVARNTPFYDEITGRWRKGNKEDHVK